MEVQAMKQRAISELLDRFSGSAASSPQQRQRGSTRSGNRAISSWLTERVGAVYLLLLTVQITGVLFIVLNGLPVFRHLVAHPGEQLAYTPYHNPATIVMVVAMQAAYWYRLRCVPIPSRRSNMILSHLLLFLGRIAFIFGGSLFAVVFFRHLPEIDQGADAWLMLRRGLQLAASLFALFCATLELERLGRSVGSSRQD
jgi:succinate dehydrogenase hydrophobic anchor subunit